MAANQQGIYEQFKWYFERTEGNWNLVPDSYSHIRPVGCYYTDHYTVHTEDNEKEQKERTGSIYAATEHDCAAATEHDCATAGEEKQWKIILNPAL